LASNDPSRTLADVTASDLKSEPATIAGASTTVGDAAGGVAAMW